MGIQERKERERQQRHQEIVDAAEKVFSDNGFGTATMDDVAKMAELSKGTLYLYFKTKDELYFAVAARGLRILGDLFAKAVESGSGSDKVRAIGVAYMDFFRDYPTYYAGLTHQAGSEVDWDDHSSPNAAACHEQGERTMGYFVQAIQSGIEDGSLRADLNPVLTGLWLWSQLSGILQFVSTRKGGHIAKDYGVSLEEVVEESFQLAMRAIR